MSFEQQHTQDGGFAADISPAVDLSPVPAQAEAEPALDFHGEVIGLANNLGFGNELEAFKNNDTGQMMARLSQELSHVYNIIARAEAKGIPHQVNTAQLEQAIQQGSTAGTLSIENALRVVDDVSKLEATVMQQELAQGLVDGGGMLTSALGGGYAAISGIDISKALGGMHTITGQMAQMNALEKSADGTFINNIGNSITSSFERFEQFVNLPNLVAGRGLGVNT